MAKNIMISEELFLKIVKHHVFGLSGFEADIEKGLNEKLNTIEKRNLYTQSKTAATEEERERNRIKYLDAVGMRESFRHRGNNIFP